MLFKAFGHEQQREGGLKLHERWLFGAHFLSRKGGNFISDDGELFRQSRGFWETGAVQERRSMECRKVDLFNERKDTCRGVFPKKKPKKKRRKPALKGHSSHLTPEEKKRKRRDIMLAGVSV